MIRQVISSLIFVLILNRLLVFYDMSTSLNHTLCAASLAILVLEINPIASLVRMMVSAWLVIISINYFIHHQEIPGAKGALAKIEEVFGTIEKSLDKQPTANSGDNK